MNKKKTEKLIAVILSCSFAFSVIPNTLMKNNVIANASVVTYNQIDYNDVNIQKNITTEDIALMHEDNWLNNYVADEVGTSIDILTIKDFLEVTDIYYSDEDVTEIPKSIKFLSNLETLDLSGNNIKTIISDIANLKRLNYLDLSNNEITVSSDYLKYLTNLAGLNLSGNKIKTYSSTLSLLEKLNYLNLSGNLLTNYSVYYNSVKEVDLSDNFLVKDCSTCFPNAKTINLAYNFINSIDEKQHNQYQLKFEDTNDLNMEVNSKIDFSKILNTKDFVSYEVIADDPSIVSSTGEILKEGTTNIRVQIKNNPEGNKNGITQEKIKIYAIKSNFIADKQSPQKVGTKITLSVPKKANETYKFIAKDESGNWVLLRDYSESNSYIWTAKTVGKKTLYVDIKNVDGIVTRKSLPYEIIEDKKENTIEISSISFSEKAPKSVGTPITLTTKATGGVGTLNYQYRISVNGKTSIISNYSKNNYCNWTPTTVGTTTVYVDVKDTNGNIVTKSTNYNIINKAPTITSLTLNKSSILVGENVEITTEATGVGILTYQFEVEDIKTGKNYVLKTYSTSNKLVWKPNADGEKIIKVKAKTEDGAISEKTVSCEVNYKQIPLQISSFNCSNKIEVGKELSFSTNAEGTGILKYKFTIIEPNSKTEKVIKDYGASNKSTFTPSSIGKYTIVSYVKDSTGKEIKTSKEVQSYSVLTLNKISLDKISPQKVGTTIKITPSVSGGYGTIKYKYYVKNLNTNKITLLKDYSTNKTYDWNPSSLGDYIIYVDVKDDTNSVVSEKIDFKIVSGYYIDSFSADKISPQVKDSVIKLTSIVKDTSTKEIIKSNLNYKFSIIDEKGNSFIIQDYSSKNTCDWKATVIGNKQLIVEVKDINGTVLKSTMNYYISKPIQISSFKSSTSSVEFGNDIKFTVNASGEEDSLNKLQYQYYYYENNEKKIIKDYSESNVCNWIADKEGNVEVFVSVKDKFNNIKTGKTNINVTTVKPHIKDFSVTQNNSICKLNTEVIGGTGNLKYKYSYIVNGKETIIGKESSLNTIYYTIQASGYYRFKVTVTDEKNNTVSQISSEKSYKFPTSFTIDKKSPQLKGTTLTLTANLDSPIGGVYQFVVEKDGKDTIIKDYSSENTYEYVANDTGNIKFKVNIKEINGTVTTKYIDYKISEPIKITSFKVDKLSPQRAGTKIKLTTNATQNNSSNGLQYQFYITDGNGKYGHILRDYSTSNTYDWDANISGDKKLIVNVKDKNGLVQSKTIDYKILEELKITSFTTDKTSPQKNGTKIKLTVNTNKIESEKLLYQFYITDDNGKYGHPLQDYSTSNVCEWDSVYSGNKKITINVKDEKGSIISKTIDYKIVQTLEVGDFVTNSTNNIGIIGNPVTLTVKNPKADSSTKYRFIVTDITSNKTYELKNSTSNTCVWTPSKHGDKKLTVYITDDYGQSITKSINYKVNKANITYETNIQSYGWIKSNEGEQGGTIGEGKRLEAVKIIKTNSCNGNISYRTYANETGWSSWTNDGNISGTVGLSRPLYKMEIKLTGDMAKYYNIEYQVHYAYQGWTKWYKNGETAAPTNNTYFIQAIKIRLVEK